MKLTFGKRLVLFLHWICSVILLAAVVYQLLTNELFGIMDGLIGAEYRNVVLIVLGVIYGFLCLAAVCVLLKRDGNRAERGFITVDSSETGKVRISVSAIEQLVKQAVGAIDGIAEMKISIASDDDAISINVNTVIVSGAHVPTVTLNMQRAIRQYVEMNCGVAVRMVSVNIQSVAVPGEGKKGKRVEPVKSVQEEHSPVTSVAEEPLPEPVPIIQMAYAPSAPQEEAPVEQPAETAESENIEPQGSEDTI